MKTSPEVAFIFDMDGVMIDSNPVHKIALKQFCRKYGQDLSEDALREKIYGRRNEDWIRNVFGALPREQVTAYAEEKEALFRALYGRDVRPVNGLPGFLQKLEDQHIARAIATSAPAANVRFTLENTGTGRFFDTILDDSFVSHGKPHPEIYVKTAAALGFEPGNCVVFEDSLSGVESARNAGCKVVGITTTHTREELGATDLVIDDFSGLDPQTIISKLFGL